jgi:hypothetical protein
MLAVVHLVERAASPTAGRVERGKVRSGPSHALQCQGCQSVNVVLFSVVPGFVDGIVSSCVQ